MVTLLVEFYHVGAATLHFLGKFAGCIELWLRLIGYVWLVSSETEQWFCYLQEEACLKKMEVFNLICDIFRIF